MRIRFVRREVYVLSMRVSEPLNNAITATFLQRLGMKNVSKETNIYLRKLHLLQKNVIGVDQGAQCFQHNADRHAVVHGAFAFERRVKVRIE